MSDPHAWKRGLERLEPGFYRDAEGALHIDSAEFLAAHGFSMSIENEDLLYRTLKRLLDAQVTAVEHEGKP